MCVSEGERGGGMGKMESETSEAETPETEWEVER